MGHKKAPWEFMSSHLPLVGKSGRDLSNPPPISLPSRSLITGVGKLLDSRGIGGDGVLAVGLPRVQKILAQVLCIPKFDEDNSFRGLSLRVALLISYAVLD